METVDQSASSSKFAWLTAPGLHVRPAHDITFLPAMASAWAYADPSQVEVQVDALWGLPDGLQVLPVDSMK